MVRGTTCTHHSYFHFHPFDSHHPADSADDATLMPTTLLAQQPPTPNRGCGPCTDLEGGGGGGAGTGGAGGQLRHHEVTAARTHDPVSGQHMLLLVQVDVTARVAAERRIAEVLEAEHKLLENVFPRCARS